MEKYYKILNQDECHHNLQYQNGINIDSVPFNPTGSCLPGGIYFAKEDILAFLNYGPWIRQAKLFDDSKVYEDPSQNPRKWKADKVWLGRKRKITAKVIKQLIDQGANVHAGNDYALCYASENGHVEIVRVLLEAGADVHAGNDYVLRFASENRHVEIVKILEEYIDLKDR